MILFIKSVLLHKFKKVPFPILQTRKLPEFCPLCIFHLILFYFDGFCFYDPILYFISKFSRDVNFLIVKLIEMHNAVCAPKLLNNNSFHSLLHWIYIGHLLFLMIQQTSQPTFSMFPKCILQHENVSNIPSNCCLVLF